MKKLPIGIQSFEKIRSDNYYYVDKTHFVAKLVNEGSYYFLSRPRRFGKSLFLDTLKQAFLGRRELFEGLYLYENWDWTKSYPVIHLDFGGGVVKDAEDLERWILRQLERNQEELEIECKHREDYRSCFEELIIRASEFYRSKVVVLIDEYDKPILDRIEEREEAKRVREVLKNLYSVIKPLDRYLKFVFITGVSKFSKVSLFSGLNQLNDITLDEDYATICGYTEEELREVFAEELFDVDLTTIRCWYDGYSFCGERVYNPFDVLLYLQKREFRPFWFETGTPEFLIKLLLKRNFFIPQMEEYVVTEELLGSFDVDFIEPENLLFQTGYLTISRCESSPAGMIYYLTYPNKEVKTSLNRNLLRHLVSSTKPLTATHLVIRCFERADLVELERHLRSLFASIPYEWHKRVELSRYEGYYASVVYSFLAGVGVTLIPEDITSEGRIDLTVLFGDRAYIMEFKVVEAEEERGRALEQIKAKRYHEKYLGKVREVYLLGVEFGREEKQIVHFVWERV